MHNKTLQFISCNSVEPELRCLKQLWWVLHWKMTCTWQYTHFVCPEPRPFKHLGDVCLKCYDGVGLLFKKIVDYQSTRHQAIPYQLWVWLSGWLLGDFRRVCCVQLGFKFMLSLSGFSFNWYTRGIPGQPDIE